MSDEKSENRYEFREIEKKWRKRWRQSNLFRVENHSDRPKSYGLGLLSCIFRARRLPYQRRIAQFRRAQYAAMISRTSS